VNPQLADWRGDGEPDVTRPDDPRAFRAVAAPIALLAACIPAPAAAEERRSALSVAVIVQPSCRASTTEVSCSAGIQWSTARNGPIAAAPSIVGEPGRRDGRILLTAAMPTPTESGTAFVTITY
jgi:hypothetical protein